MCIDGKIFLRQTREVSHHLQLRYLGQESWLITEESLGNIGFGNFCRSLCKSPTTRSRFFENQWIFHIDLVFYLNAESLVRSRVIRLD